jgi:hypothetical protein
MICTAHQILCSGDKMRRMRWMGHVARMGRGVSGFWWGNLSERGHLGDPSVDGRIILRWVLKKWNGGPVLGYCGSG